MRIASVGRALPRHRHGQEEIRCALERIWADRPELLRRLPKLHENVRVRTRHLVLPLEEYARARTFGETNDLWIDHAQALGEQALRSALDEAGLGVDEVDAVFSVSVTGIASPSLDARLVNRMGLRTDVRRTPIFGLGCVAGAAGIARAADYVRAYPDQVAALVSVELCSLTLQRDDPSVANVISTALFGDGAAAVIVVGEERARRMGLDGPCVRGSRSVFYRDTEDVMGWRISERGFEIVLSSAVPTIARERIGPDVDAFLAEHGLGREEIRTWICHPGGPKVLQGLQDGLGLTDEAVGLSWKVLAEQGNLSSTSVLMVLHEVMHGERPGVGSLGLLFAMGPAFCSEFVLLEW